MQWHVTPNFMCNLVQSECNIILEEEFGPITLQL